MPVKAKPKIKRTKTKRSIKKPAVDYVSIEETQKDPIKQKLLWLTVGLIFLGIIIFWFWNIRQNIRLNENSPELASEINKTITQARDIFTQTQDIISQPGQSVELEKIKQEIIAQLQTNLNSAGWPTHTSEILNLSIKYPTDWIKEETLKSLDLTAPGQLSARLAIISHVNKDKEGLEEWLFQNKPGINDYVQEPIILAGQNGFKYSIESEEENILYSIYLDRPDTILEIKAEAINGQNLYEPIFDQILKTLNFTK